MKGLASHDTWTTSGLILAASTVARIKYCRNLYASSLSFFEVTGAGFVVSESVDSLIELNTAIYKGYTQTAVRISERVCARISSQQALCFANS